MARARSAGGFSVDVLGFEGVKAGFLKAGTETRKATVRAVAASGGRVKTNAKDRAPKLTGDLRKSIKRKSTNGGLGQRIYSDDPNAIWQEFGTQKMPANPFMFPAAEEERSRFESTMRAEVGDALERAGNKSTMPSKPFPMPGAFGGDPGITVGGDSE